jgi:hypothetical protein
MEFLGRGGDCDRGFGHGQGFTRPNDKNIIIIQRQPAIYIKFVRDCSILVITASAANAATPNFKPKIIMNALVFSGISDHHAIREARIDISDYYLTASC